jgi:uncharacterized membrane-anchored protein
MNRRWLIPVAILVALVQIAFLSWTILGRAQILREGREIVLSVEPVDPRDLLRGDYVILGYNISRVPVSLFTNTPALPENDSVERTVFIRLKEGEDGIWQPVAASVDAPAAAALSDAEVDIRGTAYFARWESDAVRVTYGIERFYVPEGEGRQIERDLRTRSFRMKVAVSSNGTAQIKSLHDGEAMLYEEPVY